MDFSLWGLFLSAFISSTLFPGGSEAVLAYLASETQYNPFMLLFVATLGNTLGGMVTWGMGWLIAIRFPTRRLLGEKEGKALARIQRWGSPILLFSWLPVVGDPLCLVAGWVRLHWLESLVFIALGKAMRYALIIFVFQPAS